MDDDLYRVDPFSISPDPFYLYLTPHVKAILHKVRITIMRRQGLTCILGGVGVGKSTLMRHLWGTFHARDDTTSVFVPTPNYVSDFAFQRAVCGEFKVELKRSALEQESVLREWLAGELVAGRRVVLFLDEAQRLSNKMLEVVRSWLNFETNDTKLIQIVIAGQMELYERLLKDQNEAIASRIVLPNMLNGMLPEEIYGMLEHRCRVSDVEFPFTRDAVSHLYLATGGSPREALKVARAAWELMALTDRERIDVEIVEAALCEGTLKRVAGVE
jgi:general secretion pathway protein A